MSAPSSATLAALQRRNAELELALRAQTAQLKEATADRAAAREQQAATAEILAVINASPGDLASVFAAILEKAMRLCAADFGIFLTYDGQLFHTVALHNVPEPYARFMERNPPQPGPASAIGRILRGERVVRIDDVTQERAFFLGDPRRRALAELGGARSYVAVGLHQGERLLGTLAAYRQEVRPFTDQQIALLQSFAAQAAIAIENARLLTETRGALEQQSAAAEVLQIVKTAAGNLAPVFEAILDKALRLCEAAFGTLWTYDGEHMRAAATRGAPPQYLEFLSQGPHRPSRVAHLGLVGGEPVAHIADVTTTEAYRDGDPLPRAVADLGGVRTLLAVSLKSDTRLTGVLSIYRRQVRPFSERQINLLQNFAEQAVIAMENARLVDELRERGAELSRREAALRASEERYALAMSAINEGVYEWDVATGAMYYSPRVCTLVGLAESELRTMRDWTDRIHPDDKAAFRKEIIAHFKGEADRLAIEYRYRHADGSWHWARQHGIALKNDQGRVYRVVGSTGDITDRKHAEAALREALAQQTATAEVLQVINSSPGDLKPVFDAILEKAHTLCSAPLGSLVLFDGERLRAVATRGYPAEYDKLAREGFAPTEVFETLQDGERFIQDADSGTSALDREHPMKRAARDIAGVRTVLFVPLGKDATVLGYISAQRQEARPFSDKQIALLQNFAAQAVIAIDNARLLTETREALAQQTATAEVLQVINSSPGNLTPVFDTMLEKAVRLCDFAFAALWTYDGNAFHPVALHGMPAAFEAYLREHTPPAFNLLHDATGPIHFPDVMATEMPRRDPEFARAAQELGRVRTLLLVPLRKDAGLLGAFVAYRQEVRPFSDKQISLLQNFAAQAVIAMENARLLTETREALEQQTATAEVLQVINSSPGDLAPVFDAMLDKAMRLCEADVGNFWTYDGEAFTAVAMRDPRPEHLQWARQRRRGGPGSISDSLIRGESVIHIPDAADTEAYRAGEPARRAIVDLNGGRTLLAVALRRGEELLGYINIFRRVVRPFSYKQIALLQNFAAQAVIAMENARLITETREALAQQTATAEVLQVINSSPGDLAPVFDAMLEKAMALCDAAFGGLWTFDQDRYVARALRGVPVAYAKFLGVATMPPGPGTAPYRLRQGEALVHNIDLAAEEPYRAGDPQRRALVDLGGARTALQVPLRKDGDVLGVITIYRQEVRPFTDRQIGLLQNFAAQAVIAIENARLLTETREALAQQTATAEVLQVINSSPGDLAPVFDAILEKAHSLCGIALGELQLSEEGRFLAVAMRGVSGPFAELLRQPFAPPEGSPPARLLAGEPIVQLSDLLELARQRPDDLRAQAGAQYGLRTVLFVPLRKDDALLGHITAYRKEVRPFTEKEVALLQNFAAQAVIAMENTRLITETREALEQQTATAEVLQVINASPGDLAPVFDAMLERALRLCGGSFGELRTYEGDSRFRLRATHGVPTAYVQHYARGEAGVYGPGTGPARILAGERIVHIPDLVATEPYRRGDPDRAALVDLGGARAYVLVPLLKDNEVLGYVMIYRMQTGPFSDKQISLLQSFAAQAVIAMDNARLLDEIRQRQAELRVTFDNMGDGVAMFDAGLRLAAWNTNFQKMLDLPDALVAERPNYKTFIRYLAHRGEFGGQDVEAELSQRLENTDEELRFERTRPDGRVIEVRRNRVPGGGFVLIYGDVTERKRAEAEIRAARDAAEAALAELKTAQASLIHAEKMASLGQLTAGIAHEIKNPLNFVNNFAGVSIELLEELKDTAGPGLAGLDSETRVEVDETIDMLTGNLAKIAEHGRRADGIVQSMLAHSRGGSGERQTVDLNALVEEALNLAYHGARAQDQDFAVTLERDFAAGVVPVAVVPQDLTRVFLNLIGNGFYAATRKNGKAGHRPVLRVATRDLGETVEVRVRDNGAGIPPEHRDKLFQPFFTTKPTGEGTGLGLSICYEIVTQRHGGTITVDSTPGEFSEFIVRLPRQRP